MSRARQAAERAAQAGLDAAVSSATSPAAAKAARPITRRVAPILVSVALMSLAGWMVFAVAVGGAVSIPALMVANATFASETKTPGQVCLPDMVAGSLDDVPELSSNPATRTDQLENAAIIIAAGRAAGVPARGWVVGMAVGLVESNLLNLPSEAMPDSLNYPHDTFADGTIPAGDHQSVGLMQGQPWWWNNNMADGMNPAFQARQFFGGADDTPDIPGLLDILGWEDMPVWEAAQDVQRSAFPMRYGDVEASATILVQALADVDPGTCQPQAGGDWQWPLDPLPNVSSPFGMRRHPTLGVVKLHDGTDYAPPCNTPIVAAGSGTARVEHPAWSGNLLVIDHGGGVETWYGHMSSISVSAGDAVTAGQTVGAVGTLGYSTGCHLHFMVVVDGVPVDPVPWMRTQIEKAPPAPDRPGTPPALPGDGGALSVLTYNVHYGRAQAATREVESLAERRTPSVICLQEAAGVKRAPAGYRMWRPRVPTHGGRGPTATPILVSNKHTVTAKGFINLTGREWVGQAGAGPLYATPRQIVWVVLDDQTAVGCTHFTASKEASKARAQLHARQVAGAADYLRGGGTRLLAGDFNATADSKSLRPLRRVAVADNNRAATLGARIDMVWGANATPGPARTLPKLGSDHRPVYTTWETQR